MSAREAAVRALLDARSVYYRGADAVWEARDILARSCARAVQRWDWPAATTYAAAYDLLTDLYDRAYEVRGMRSLERAS